jgi:hypothetical protein
MLGLGCPLWQIFLHGLNICELIQKESFNLAGVLARCIILENFVTFLNSIKLAVISNNRDMLSHFH